MLFDLGGVPEVLFLWFWWAPLLWGAMELVSLSVLYLGTEKTEFLSMCFWWSLPKHRERNGRRIVIPFKSIRARGWFDSPELTDNQNSPDGGQSRKIRCCKFLGPELRKNLVTILVNSVFCCFSQENSSADPIFPGHVPPAVQFVSWKRQNIGQALSGLPSVNAKSQRFSHAISQITPLPPV